MTHSDSPVFGQNRGFSRPRQLPWEAPVGLAGVLDRWQASPRVFGHVALHERLAPVAARFAPIPERLASPVAEALRARGVHELYAHQARAFEQALAGRDIVVATPTASGKSLCYNLPVLHALATDPSARALYLFPTKALSRDQEAAFQAFARDAGLTHGAITYDGDTPADARRNTRQRSSVVITNPDMLHAGILPHHTAWARLFANLRYVVIDELHTYRGVFGSHVSNLLRRLDRIARFYGSKPVFLMASATIGNPQEHAAAIIGREVCLIDESGAPRGPRRLIVYNPPVVNAELGIRESYIKATVRLTSDLVLAGVSTLVFGQSRNTVEVMLKYLRERLARARVAPERVAAYRGGYLPGLRRTIEQALRDGALSCVVATNALELGIDIGMLDAVVCAGYPGTLSGLWQRVGRAGRRGNESLALMVCSSAPLDQYVAREHDYLLGTPVEQARIDPDNAEILVQHVKCSAFELPFEGGEPFGDVAPEVVHDALDFLQGHGLLHAVESGDKHAYHWASQAYPANHVSLRSVGWDNFVIVDLEREATLAEMDWRAAHTMLHEQAIYQHDAAQYQVERLDFENRKAFVRRVNSEYFTDAMTHVRVAVLEVTEAGALQELAGAAATSDGHAGAGPAMTGPAMGFGRGDVSVVEKVVGYKKIKYQTHENVGYGEVNLPEMQMHTTAFWLTVPESIVQAQPVSRPMVIDAMHGLAHALHTVASIGLMTDPCDIGHTLGDRGDERFAGKSVAEGAALFDPTIFVYDRMPGGIGLCPRLFSAREELVRHARALIEGCDCAEGCPGCVGPVAVALDGVDLATSRKHVALALLSELGVQRTH